MKKVEKRKLTKNQKTIIISALVLLILVAAYIVTDIIAKNINKTEEPADTPYVNEALGEVLYMGNAVAYAPLEESEILDVLVTSKEKGSYVIKRLPDDNSKFMFLFDSNKDGTLEMYMPPIANSENEFDYEEMYSIEENDGIGRIYTLSYLCSALSSPGIAARIELPNGDTEESRLKREALLKEYGFSEGEVVGISFDYGERDETNAIINRGTHNIFLGERAVSNSGFYYMVDGRDVIYYTTNNFFEYAQRGIEEYVKGMLVSIGGQSNSSFEPYLTPEFKEWVNTQHKKDEEAISGPIVEAGSKVIARGEQITPDSAQPDGYSSSSTTLTFDLEDLKSRPDYERISALLVGKEVGLDYSNDPIIITMLMDLAESEGKKISFSGLQSRTYTYKITKIESIVLDSFENDTEGAVVEAGSLVKIAYTLQIDGIDAPGNLYHAIADLSKNESFAEALVGKTVGAKAEPITVSVTYTPENTSKIRSRIVVTDIIEIYDALGNAANKIEATSYVKIRYYEEQNGIKGDKRVMYISLADLTAGSVGEAIGKATLGMSKGENLEIVALDETSYYEDLGEFIVCSVSNIEYYVTSELVVSFGFVNFSQRDPYYGESIYENTLGKDNKYSLYGLNEGICEEVVRMLGGISESTSSKGLYGKTVALGLTPENMDYYKLYAYTVKFTLPRGIEDITEDTEWDDEDTVSDFAWLNEISFTLYISEENPETGKRYVGSDMYDIIAEVDGEIFDFLNYDFTEFWVRRKLFLTRISNVDVFKIEFSMDDVYGNYTFDVNMETVWGGLRDGKFVTSSQYIEGFTEMEKLYVALSQTGNCFETEFSKYLASIGKDKASATDFYNQVVGGGKPLYDSGSIDSVGVVNFKLAFEQLQLTNYDGVLTDEEIANAKDSPRVMRLHFKLNQSAFYYTYDFYRIDDRKIMVELYRTDENGNKVQGQSVCDFYISTYAFKKVAGGFIDFLNAKNVGESNGYPK